MIVNKGYELDDILLIPDSSSVVSRDMVDLSVKLGDTLLSIPIIASPMAGIVGIELIKGLGELGGIGILHRFYNDPQKRSKDLAFLNKSATNFGVAIGLNDEFYKEALDDGASIICVDVANGYLDSVLEFSFDVKQYITTRGYKCSLMAGNVATYDGALTLNRMGVDLIRCGIGSGNLCTTRKNTGIGVPQATAISDCSNEPIFLDPTTYKLAPFTGSVPWYVVADGGIRNSGDAVKALACGATLIMMGTLFSTCFESSHNGEICGMASKEFQEQFYGKVRKSVEGVQKPAEKSVSLESFINEFVWNMKSGFTYTDSRDIMDLHLNARFIETGSGSIKEK